MFHAQDSMDVPLLTPRQDRLENAVASLIRARATRSELRETVHHLVDLFVLQGIPSARGVARIEEVASDAAPHIGPSWHGAGDSRSDCLTLIRHWATQRYHRAD
jgi:hypothetical protein